MTLASGLSLSAILLGLLGSVVLAASLNQVIEELITGILLLDDTVLDLCRGGPVVKAEGIRMRLERGLRAGRRRTILGVILLGCAPSVPT